MPRAPSIQWYYKQYLGDNKVLAMDWDARGMHMHLLMLSIQEQPPGTIPADDAAIRRWLSLPSNAALCNQRGSERDPAKAGRVSGYDCGCNDCVWRRVKPQLLAAWQPEGERLVNSGMIETIARKENYKNRGKVRDRYETGTKSPPNLAKTKDVIEVLLTKPQIQSQNPPTGDLLVEEILRLHPANWHWRNADNKMLQLPQAQCAAVIEAMVRHGPEQVLAGTQAYAEHITLHPGFVMKPERFFGAEAHYLKSKQDWENSNAKQPVSKDKQRFLSNLEAVGFGPRSRRAPADLDGTGSPDDRPRTHARVGKALGVGTGGKDSGTD